MRRASWTDLLFAFMLIVLAAVAWIIFDAHATLTFVLPSFATGATILLAGGAALSRVLREQRRGDAQYITDVSWATVLIAIGLSIALFGLTLGQWLMYIGGGIFAFGLGGLIRELVTERQLRERR